MASAWSYPPHREESAFSLPKPSRRSCRISETTSNWKSRVAALMKRALNMSSCTQQSRVLITAMRSQLKVALEERELAASPSPSSSSSSSPTPQTYSSIVTCNSCGGFMVQPVCMPCGHSVCKGCIEKSTMLRGENLVCPKCNQSCPKIPASSVAVNEPDSPEKHRMPTLTLQNAFCKWYPKWVESTQCREEGNRHANKSDFVSAVRWYSQALETGVCDYRVLGNRSRSYLALDKLEEACQDAELACRLHPFWAKGHYRRGAVLERQGRWREAIAAYLLCLHLGGGDQQVVKTVCQLLDKNASGAEKKLPSTKSSSKMGSSVFSGDSASPVLAPPPSSASSSAPLTSSCQSLLSVVVELAVRVIAECVEVEEAMREETRASVSPAPPELVDVVDFECVLCTGLLFDPVTTPCGHSFCRSCLCRSFDHSPSCPICRQVLIESFQQHCQNLGKIGVDVTLEGVLLHYFHDAYLEKQSQVNSEIQKSLIAGTSEMETLPVFVCTMAYPGLACPLHIFEPRYRLMVRRCMENGSKRFGMCQPAAATGGGSVVSFADYGTVLHISNVELLEDGRSLISTEGERRFQVLGRGLRDGYQTARIMFLFDERVTDRDEIVSLRALQQETYDHAKKWLENAPFFSRMMMMQVVTTPLPEIDPVPECCPNGPKWVWWFIHALPTTPTMKLDFLKCTSLHERLLMLKELLPLDSAE